MKVRALFACVIFVATPFGLFAFTGSGAGNSGSPFQITTCSQLQEMKDDIDAYYILMNDIDCSATTGWNGGAGFAPVGTTTPYFSGSLDGDGYTVSDLFINRPSTSQVAMFGRVSAGFNFVDLTLEDIDVTGLQDVGGLIGLSSGAGTITNVTVTGSLTGSGTDIGLLAGEAAAVTVTNATTSGYVTNLTSSNTGGLIGNFGGTSITGAYSDAEVSGKGITGGLIGFANRASYTSSTYFIADSKAEGNVSGTSDVGGFVGRHYNIDVRDSFASGNVNGSNGNVGGFIGWRRGGEIVEDSWAVGDVYGGLTSNDVGGFYGGIDNVITTGGITRRSFALGNSNGYARVGGFSGILSGGANAVQDSYARGSATTRSSTASTFIPRGTGGVLRSYGTGLVGGSSTYGFGGDASFTISCTDSFWDTDTSGKSTTLCSATGKTTSAMTSVATFTDTATAGLSSPWDFIGNPNDDVANNDYWDIDPAYNDGYPFLAWQTFVNPVRPSTQATNVTFSDVSQHQVTISWTNGNGSKRAVFMKAASSGSASPVDEISYTASTTFAGGTQIGTSGWYLVYKGKGTRVTVDSLTPGTAYQVHVVEYDGLPREELYFSNTATNNPNSQTTTTFSTPSTSATNVTMGDIAIASTTVSWTSGDGSGRIVFMAATTTESSPVPVDGTTYTANAAFGSGSQIGSTGWYAVYKGTGSSVTVSNLSYSTAYRVHVVEYNGSAGAEKYRTTSGTGNPATKSAYAGTTRYANYSTGNDSTGNGTSGSPYKTFHRTYLAALDGDTINLTGTFTWSNADETGDTVNGYTIAKPLTITGQKAGDTIVQAATTDNTADRRVFFVSAGVSATFQNLTMRYGKLSAMGGCLYGNANSILTLRYVDVFSCRSVSTQAAGYYMTSGTTTIEHSSFRSNIAGTSGGGIIAAAGDLIITNSTFSRNWTATSSAQYGGAIYVNAGRTWITNSTLAYNEGYYGALSILGASTVVYLKNTLIANNTAVSAASADLYRNSNGTFTSSGYNVVGRYTPAHFATTTGDWADTDGNGTYTLTTAGTTGTLSIDPTAAVNDTYGTYTHAFTSDSSVGVDDGTATAHTGAYMTIAIPSTDQRGTSRNGTTDVGAHEGTSMDLTAPTVQTLSPADNATGVSGSANLVITFTENIATTSGKSLTIKKSSDDTTVESIASNSALLSISGATATVNPSTTLTGGIEYYVQIESGMFEDAAGNDYTGISDTTSWSFTTADAGAPSVSLTLPDDGANIKGNAIGIQADASDDGGIAGVRFFVNNIPVGSEDTSSPYGIVWNSLSATSSGTKRVFAVARDNSNNYATSSVRTVTLANQPEPQSVQATGATNGATIAWTTPVEGSSKVFFGVGSAMASSTPERNSGSHVTSHSVALAGLPSCSVFKYLTVSKNAQTEFATSSETTFKTAGCTGGASITANGEQAITTASGGTLSQGALELTVPASFTSAGSSLTFQAAQLAASTFDAGAGAPTGKVRGGEVFHLTAFLDEDTIVDDFDAPLEVTLSFDDGEIMESTAAIHRYDGTTWHELTNCVVDVAADEVTCETEEFSDFTVFGDDNPDAQSDGAIGAAGGGPSLIARAEMIARLSADIASSSSVYATSFVRDLYRGVVGEDVRLLQRLLNAGGFTVAHDGAGAPGEESLHFGSRTEEALKKFQAFHGIVPAAGYFGRLTRMFVANMNLSATSTPGVVQPEGERDLVDARTFTKDLQRGAYDPDVTALQEFLIASGTGPAAAALEAAGTSTFFGTRTKEALIEYQVAAGITPADGYFGAKTRAMMAR